MAKHKRHIPHKPDDQYPKPDIPADDAWANMLSMLNAELPVNPEADTPLKKPVNGANFLIIKSIITVLTVAGIALVTWLSTKPESRPVSEKVENTTITQADSNTHLDYNEKAVLKNSEIKQDGVESTIESESHNTDLQPIENNITDETFSKNESKTNIKAHENNLILSTVNKNIDSKKRSKNKAKTLVNTTVQTDHSNRRNQYSKSSEHHLERTERQMDSYTTPPKPDAGKVNKSDIKNPWLYPLSTIPAPSLSSLNRLNRSNGIPVKKSYTPLIINDSTIAKQNHFFWKSVHFGLTWNAPVPFSSGTSMILQANGKEEAWPLLLPGIWISKEFDNKNTLLLWSKAYNQHYVNQLIQHTQFPTSDSAGRYYEKSLLVVQAFQAGVQYNRTIFQKWQLGLGLAYNHSGKALLRGKEILIPGNIVLSDTTYSIKPKAMDWPLVKPSYISGRIEAAYSFRKIKAGVALTIPITSLTDSVKTKPVNGQIFLRWQIR